MCSDLAPEGAFPPGSQPGGTVVTRSTVRERAPIVVDRRQEAHTLIRAIGPLAFAITTLDDLLSTVHVPRVVVLLSRGSGDVQDAPRLARGDSPRADHDRIAADLDRDVPIPLRGERFGEEIHAADLGGHGEAGFVADPVKLRGREVPLTAAPIVLLTRDPAGALALAAPHVSGALVSTLLGILARPALRPLALLSAARPIGIEAHRRVKPRLVSPLRRRSLVTPGFVTRGAPLGFAPIGGERELLATAHPAGIAEPEPAPDLVDPTVIALRTRFALVSPRSVTRGALRVIVVQNQHDAAVQHDPIEPVGSLQERLARPLDSLRSVVRMDRRATPRREIRRVGHRFGVLGQGIHAPRTAIGPLAGPIRVDPDRTLAAADAELAGDLVGLALADRADHPGLGERDIALDPGDLASRLGLRVGRLGIAKLARLEALPHRLDHRIFRGGLGDGAHDALVKLETPGDIRVGRGRGHGPARVLLGGCVDGLRDLRRDLLIRQTPPVIDLPVGAHHRDRRGEPRRTDLRLGNVRGEATSLAGLVEHLLDPALLRRLVHRHDRDRGFGGDGSGRHAASLADTDLVPLDTGDLDIVFRLRHGPALEQRQGILQQRVHLGHVGGSPVLLRRDVRRMVPDAGITPRQASGLGPGTVRP